MPRSSSSLHCAAVDLGATSGRVIVGTWTKNKLTLTEVHRFPNAFHSLAGHDYWDVPTLWSEVQAGLRQAAAQFKSIASIGVDTWGVDHALVNDAGRLVYPVHAYRDARTQPGLQKLSNTRAALARIYAATGIPAVFYNSSLQLAETVASCPAIEDLATRCLFLPDYFNFLLTGRMTNGLSIASTAQLLDVHRDDWSREALDYFRIPSTWFTAPIRSGTKLGKLLPEFRKLSPALRDTQLIAVPGHDTTCAYDAIPASPDGTDLLLSSGTWSLVGFESDTPLLGAEALAARVANDRTGRGGYRPLVNVIGLWLLEKTLADFSSRPRNESEWSTLIAAAEKLPSSLEPVHPRRSKNRSGLSALGSGLLDVTDPAFANPPSMRAAIDAQLKRRKLPVPKNLPAYVRLICDSLGQGHANVMRTFERLANRRFKRILIVGGGSKNRLLCQATANAAQLPVISFQLEGTAVGNLANQLIALRAIKDLPTFRALLSRQIQQTVYQPKAQS